MRIETAKDLAYAVKSRVRPELTPRPWQYQAPDDTLWWLVPSSDWPAYRHGKFVFSFAKDSPRKGLLGLNDRLIETNKLFAGVNVEKGYGREATEVDPVLRRRTDQIMDPGWLWHQLIQETGARRFAAALGAVSSQAPLHLYVVSSFVHDRQADPPRERDAIVFGCATGGITKLLSNGFPVGVLRACEKVTSFVELVKELQQVDGYHWVDIYAGVYVAKGDQDVALLDRTVLSHLSPWVVEAPKQ